MNRCCGGVFPQGEGLGFAVNRGGAAEDKCAAIVTLHGGSEHAAAGQVYVPVPKRFSDGLTHRFEASEMDHSINSITASEGTIHSIRVTHIPFNHVHGVGSRQLLNSAESLR